MSSKDFSIKTTQGDMMDILDLCKKMNLTPKAMQEDLERLAAEHDYGPETDVIRMIAALKAIRSTVYRMDVGQVMHSLH